jgi:hypothetical protein
MGKYTKVLAVEEVKDEAAPEGEKATLSHTISESATAHPHGFCVDTFSFIIFFRLRGSE